MEQYFQIRPSSSLVKFRAKMRLKQLFMKAWILCSAFFVRVQVSDPQRRTDFALTLKMRSFVCVLISLHLQMFLSMLNVTLA